MTGDFILRILLFCVSIFYMIEYIIVCDVSTPIGFAVIVGGIILTSIVYYMMRGKRVETCGCCNRSFVKS